MQSNTICYVELSPIAGNGVFARRDINKGEEIFELVGKRVSGSEVDKSIATGKISWDDPYQVSLNTYLILEPFSKSFNHSCTPNAGVRDEGTLFALRTIEKGDEITFDYSTTVGRDNSLWDMACRCGSILCRGSIGPWDTLPKPRLEYYLDSNALTKFVLKEMNS